MKKTSKELYGEIEHQTMGDFVRMILDFLVCWTKDLGAELERVRGLCRELLGPMNHYLQKHPLVREKVNSARDARARRGNLSVPLDAWARCGANGVRSLTLADVRVMAWDAELLRQSLTESVDNSS
jgi:hypothetical protein